MLSLVFMCRRKNGRRETKKRAVKVSDAAPFDMCYCKIVRIPERVSRKMAQKSAVPVIEAANLKKSNF